ncbi:hypothetical protein K491DRAFT_63830 [Lophiostoma macrostomum CBS 122681]|uniref:Secreted protein n=1 Tax=Lophiostoma macrostomum CBS 122681 TaxID=1314788 RepID=A0A6A6SWW7_9PLEO|nr:hypothetical protein K491DRAFT_63830 [Lophiostoma macrostomum CBS 122681]
MRTAAMALRVLLFAMLGSATSVYSGTFTTLLNLRPAIVPYVSPEEPRPNENPRIHHPIQPQRSAQLRLQHRRHRHFRQHHSYCSHDQQHAHTGRIDLASLRALNEQHIVVRFLLYSSASLVGRKRGYNAGRHTDNRRDFYCKHDADGDSGQRDWSCERDG